MFSLSSSPSSLSSQPQQQQPPVVDAQPTTEPATPVVVAKPNNLGQMMKSYEYSADRISPYESFVVKLDGRRFAKFAKQKFNKSFNDAFCTSMVQTMNYVINVFKAYIGYTCGNEMSFVFKAKCSREQFDENPHKNTHMHDGCVFQIITLITAAATAKFNLYLNHAMRVLLQDGDNSTLPQPLLKTIKKNNATFYGNIFVLPGDDASIIEYLRWRSSISESASPNRGIYGKSVMVDAKRPLLRVVQNKKFKIQRDNAVMSSKLAAYGDSSFGQVYRVDFRKHAKRNGNGNDNVDGRVNAGNTDTFTWLSVLAHLIVVLGLLFVPIYGFVSAMLLATK